MLHASISQIIVATCLVGGLAVNGFAQQLADARSSDVPAARAAEPAGKFTFYLFWKANDVATQQMSTTLQTAVAKRAERAVVTVVNVNDAANRPIVDRFQAGRMPMPAVICVAPNGAVTGAHVRKINDEAVEGSIVSPAGADIVKALQDKKIAVIHVAQDAKTPLPTGVALFIADPAFQARTTVISIIASDPAEAPLLKSMEIDPRSLTGSTDVILAPPGVLVGKFPDTVTMEQIAAALHAAGKCCNDPNCKHNQKAKQQ